MKIHSKKDDPFYKFNQLYKIADSGCWEWTGFIGKKGYGQQRFGDRKIYVHRYSFELHNGPIKDGLFVCHKCDNRKCVNPDHLFLGTMQDNVNDCIAKNRLARGENKPLSSKLNNDKVRQIRSLFNTGKYFHKDLADKFGVSRTTITLIVNNKRWSHI
jgi:DNA-binding XRE family transcriptional regulator